jgi:hypothetical protein
MRVNISGKQEYTPKWNGNRKLPAADRLRVEYRYMSCEEEEQFSLFIPKYDTGDTSSVELEIKSHANEIWDLCVVKVHGFVDEAGKEITDPKAVRKVPGVYGLVTEVVAEIRKGITEEEAKNA